MTTTAVKALAAMLETALAVADDRMWIDAIDRAGTHRPCDQAMYALADHFGVRHCDANARELIQRAKADN